VPLKRLLTGERCSPEVERAAVEPSHGSAFSWDPSDF
jgi:hypothetical protein